MKITPRFTEDAAEIIERQGGSMTKVETHVCLLNYVHGPHEWWYTSEGGGHMIAEMFANGSDRKWVCPGFPLDEEEA